MIGSQLSSVILGNLFHMSSPRQEESLEKLTDKLIRIECSNIENLPQYRECLFEGIDQVDLAQRESLLVTITNLFSHFQDHFQTHTKVLDKYMESLTDSFDNEFKLKPGRPDKKLLPYIKSGRKHFYEKISEALVSADSFLTTFLKVLNEDDPLYKEILRGKVQAKVCLTYILTKESFLNLAVNHIKHQSVPLVTIAEFTDDLARIQEAALSVLEKLKSPSVTIDDLVKARDLENKAVKKFNEIERRIQNVAEPEAVQSERTATAAPSQTPAAPISEREGLVIDLKLPAPQKEVSLRSLEATLEDCRQELEIAMSKVRPDTGIFRFAHQEISPLLPQKNPVEKASEIFPSCVAYFKALDAVLSNCLERMYNFVRHDEVTDAESSSQFAYGRMKEILPDLERILDSAIKAHDKIEEGSLYLTPFTQKVEVLAYQVLIKVKRAQVILANKCIPGRNVRLIPNRVELANRLLDMQEKAYQIIKGPDEDEVVYETHLKKSGTLLADTEKVKKEINKL